MPMFRAMGSWPLSGSRCVERGNGSRREKRGGRVYARVEGARAGLLRSACCHVLSPFRTNQSSFLSTPGPASCPLARPQRERFAKYSESFMREAEVLAKLNHPNIIRMYGVVSGASFMRSPEVCLRNSRLAREGQRALGGVAPSHAVHSSPLTSTPPPLSRRSLSGTLPPFPSLPPLPTQRNR